MLPLAARDALIEQHRPLALMLAWQLRHVRDRSVDFEDLQAAAMLGLVKAANKFDPSRGLAFGTLAGVLIRGEMKQTLRAADWLSRSARAEVKANPERAEELPRLVSLDADADAIAEMVADEGAVDAEARAICRDQSERLARAVGKLSARYQTVLRAYYYENLTNSEVGRLLGVSEQRACQIRYEALGRLRERLAPAECSVDLSL